MPRQVPHGNEALSSNEAQPVWDLPTRIVHWLLAALIAFSWWSVHNHHTDWHIWSGCAILTLLIFRLLWGFVGSSTARFSSFLGGPRAMGNSLRGQWAGIGHDPIGGLSVVALLLAVAIQVGLGLIAQDEDGIYTGPLYRLVSSATSDKARDFHASWFNVVIALIALHIAAVIFYHLRGRRLTKAMITGRTVLDPGTQPMRRGKGWVALTCLALGIGVTRWIIAGAPPFAP